jgi:hypothetical protein
MTNCVGTGRTYGLHGHWQAARAWPRPRQGIPP